MERNKLTKLKSLGVVKTLKLTPIIDFYSNSKELKTEAGTAHFIEADNIKILFDLGLNAKSEHPSPLLQNMKLKGISLDEIDMIFLSHIHSDHIGGLTEHKKKLFSISQGNVEISDIPVYAPDVVSPSKWNPNLKVKIVKEPEILKPGIASIGAIFRKLFLLGDTYEHSLAINVENKGIVLVVGCGHQTIEAIIERSQQLFDEPIYAIIGGLHFPVRGGRVMFGPINFQHWVGSHNPPWKGLNEESVYNSINLIKKVNPKIISLSAHDSSDWAIEKFKEEFKERYIDLKVGSEINF